MISLDGRRLSTADVAAAASGAPVEVTAHARERAAGSHEFATRVSAERPVYGRTTGVGANRSEAVPDDGAHALALLRSHATSAGPWRSAERVRATLVVRLNQLAAGGSGASPEVLDALTAMLDADALPQIREFGNIGTGDISALAAVALALAGETSTSHPMPVRLAVGAHDALPLISSNAATIGDAALAVFGLRRLADAAVVVAALTFAAVDGNGEAFAEAAEVSTPFDGAREVCRRVRSLVSEARPAARIQDPFGLRTLPQVHGAFIDALSRLDEVITTMANAPAENPVLLPGVGIAHHGGFHATYLAQALDAALSALAQAADLTLARISMLNEPALTGLPAFLGDGTPGASGVMVLEYVAASLLATLRGLAHPSSGQGVTLSRGVEESASFASQAAVQALDAVPVYRSLIACELVACVRAVRMRDLDLAHSPLSQPLSLCDVLDRAVADRDLSADIELAAGLTEVLADLGD
ncbi:MAG: histidine ammonia-lyase [Actinomycetota bacterium]|nr:histidine ammonia-lyase [Actinomycetota bacterium]